MSRLLLITPWFGGWPAWINFFIESCKYNPEVNWLIPTDQIPPENRSTNIEFERISFSGFRERVSDNLGINLNHMAPYKLCDLRPFFGLIFERELAGYKSFGYCDLDIIWGNILETYTDDILGTFEAISSHSDRMSGHLSVFQNTPKMRSLGTRIAGWRRRLSSEQHLGLDEGSFTRLIKPSRVRFIRRLMAPNALFQERFSTPGVDEIIWPDGSTGANEWWWKDGSLGNHVFPRGLPYLHFMLWQSDRWRRSHAGPAPWPLLDDVIQCNWRDMSKEGISLSPRGIRLLGASMS